MCEMVLLGIISVRKISEISGARMMKMYKQRHIHISV